MSDTTPIHEREADDRPQERAEKNGIESLSIPDLLALILRTGRPGLPVTLITRSLMKANGGSLHNLQRRTRKELRSFNGLGVVKSLQIEAVMELIRRYNLESTGNEITIRSSEDIASVMSPRIGNLDHEEIWMMTLNRANKLINTIRLTTGGTSSSVFDVKILLKNAILENAEGVVLCHNHPSGTLRPSIQDDNITKICKDACASISIRMLDHVIVSANGYYSYCDNGKL